MIALEFTLRAAPALRVDLRGVTPLALAALDAEARARQVVWHGNQRVTLGDLFAIRSDERRDKMPVLRLVGDLSRFDRIGWAMDGGRIDLEGAAGDYLGALMTAGEIRCSGTAGLFAGSEMAGGRLLVGGSVGDFAAGSRPGSMEGMRGGELLVRGNAGARLGDRMRRGLLAVHGDAGDFAASRLVAGTIAVGGTLGAFPAFGMRRGTLVLARPIGPTLAPTFVPTPHDITVFWRLLARQLAALGAPFESLAARHPQRLVGDLAVDGKGEVLHFA
jgi:formylmethanofuran dehydrogenase subunit C